MTRSEDDVVLKLLHTADWHLGRRFDSFDDADAMTLSRARMEVLRNILLVAEQHDVDAILCAGDLFDQASPEKQWWERLADEFQAMKRPRPVILLPGNHDPVRPGSVYDSTHPFRSRLPPWVHVVDRDDFTMPLKDVAVVYARPCRSAAGQDDPAMALPARESGDDKIRIGLVHGSTFDAVDCQTNFPIAKEAAALRGLDYLAIGDTHGFRVVPPGAVPPVVYPGAPEPTNFGEVGAGSVVVVFVSRSRRVRYQPQRVAAWTWEERTVRSLAELRALDAETKLRSWVLRLNVDMRLAASDLVEAERLISKLKGDDSTPGRVGILQLVRRRLELDTRDIESALSELPDVLRATVASLKAQESGAEAEVARAALYHLYRLVREAS
ncbi:MAG: DNA repair exonuclease [Deltaproteobacteria bacterium]|nr:DNA repair exonuclease [Deltaproteobacteria bacterium]